MASGKDSKTNEEWPPRRHTVAPSPYTGPSHATPILLPSWSSSDIHWHPWPSTQLDPTPGKKRGHEDEKDTTQPPVKRKCHDDEETKRQQHLIKNRQAASKCRQKKKEWIAQMQETVTVVSAENQRLQHQVLILREEILHLKTLLLSYRSHPPSSV